MIQGSVASAHRQSVANRSQHELLRMDHRVEDGASKRKIRRDRGREGTAGSMGVWCVNSGDLKLGEDPAIEQHIDDSIADRVSAGDDDRRTRDLMDLVR